MENPSDYFTYQSEEECLCPTSRRKSSLQFDAALQRTDNDKTSHVEHMPRTPVPRLADMILDDTPSCLECHSSDESSGFADDGAISSDEDDSSDREYIEVVSNHVSHLTKKRKSELHSILNNVAEDHDRSNKIDSTSAHIQIKTPIEKALHFCKSKPVVKTPNPISRLSTSTVQGTAGSTVDNPPQTVQFDCHEHEFSLSLRRSAMLQRRNMQHCSS